MKHVLPYLMRYYRKMPYTLLYCIIALMLCFVFGHSYAIGNLDLQLKLMIFILMAALVRELCAAVSDNPYLHVMPVSGKSTIMSLYLFAVAQTAIFTTVLVLFTHLYCAYIEVSEPHTRQMVVELLCFNLLYLIFCGINIYAYFAEERYSRRLLKICAITQLVIILALCCLHRLIKANKTVIYSGKALILMIILFLAGIAGLYFLAGHTMKKYETRDFA